MDNQSHPSFLVVSYLSCPHLQIAKHFLDPKLNEKVKFVYTNNPESHKMVSELFGMDKLETAFGGTNSLTFDIDNYAGRMRRGDLVRGALSMQTEVNQIRGHQ